MKLRFLIQLLILCLVIPAASWGSSYALIVSSASGNSDFKEKFWTWSRDLVQIFRDEMGIPADQVILLTEDPDLEPRLANGKATKIELLKALQSLQSRADQASQVFILLLGHGSFDGSDYKFNLVGPDITGSELKIQLDRLASSQVVLVSTTPCSGILTKTLSRKGRVVITATKSEFEGNETIFGEFFVDAFRKKAADSDKNASVSILEAYQYTAQKVENWYKERGRLATEHPLLEDSGDANGASRPSPANGEGLLASRISLPEAAVLAPGGISDPELQALQASKQKLETSIQELKYRKASLSEADYTQQMEDLLILLAQTNQKIKAKQK